LKYDKVVGYGEQGLIFTLELIEKNISRYRTNYGDSEKKVEYGNFQFVKKLPASRDLYSLLEIDEGKPTI